jgi:hypothetical protein
MEAVEVYVGEAGHVCIKGEDYGNGGDVVLIAPEQVDVLIEWLKEVKAEALEAKQYQENGV